MDPVTPPAGGRDAPSDGDLDAMTRAHFARPEVRAKDVADYFAARRAAERPEPPALTTVPAPTFPRDMGIGQGVARFHCPRGCGWWHDEPTDPGPSPLIFDLGGNGASVEEMLSLNAEAAGLAWHARVEAAITEHYTAAH